MRSSQPKCNCGQFSHVVNVVLRFPWYFIRNAGTSSTLLGFLTQTQLIFTTCLFFEIQHKTN